MLRVRALGVVLALLAGAAMGDAILTPGVEIFSVLPGSIGGSLGNGTAPYWDNASTDLSQSNVGYFLTGTGAYGGAGGATFYTAPGAPGANLGGSSNTNYNPTGYLSQNNGAGNADSPSNIAFQHNSGLTMTLLDSLSEAAYLEFGYYDASQLTGGGAAASEVAIYGNGSSRIGLGLAPDVGSSPNLSGIGYSQYGFFLVECVAFSGSSCTSSVTLFSNAALNTTDAGLQHFAVFETANPGTFFVAFSDGIGFNPLGGGQGIYDGFNDAVFELNSNPVPEPATLVLMGVGLLGLGFARRRCAMRLA